MKKIFLSLLVFGLVSMISAGLIGSGVTGVNLISPEENGFYNGDELTVEWEWLGDININDVAYGDILYSDTGCGEDWYYVAGPFGTADPTNYDWDISDLEEGNNYCVLFQTNDPEIFDTSGEFTIDRTNPEASIEVTDDGDEKDQATEVEIDAEDENGIAFCEIDWQDGSTTDCLETISGDYSHQYSDSGEYDITLTVRDFAGNEDTDSDEADVDNVAPWNVDITTTQESAAVGEAVLFEAVAEDAQGDLDAGLTCLWIFDGEDEVEVTADDTGYCFTYYTWTEASIHTVDLTVSDKDGGATDAEQYLIEIVEPFDLTNQEVAAFYALEADFGQGYGNEFEHNVVEGVCEKISPDNPGLVIGNNNGRCVVNWNDPRPTNDEKGEHLVIVKVSNTEGDYEYYSFTITVYSWIIPLYEGWNLISIPLVHETGDIEDVFIDQLYDCLPGGTDYPIWSYQFNGEESLWLKTRRTGTGDLDTVEPGHAYWIEIECEETELKGFGDKLSPPPSGLPPEVDVPFNGWMFIGRYGIVGTDFEYRQAGDLPKETALMSLFDGDKTVLEYNGLGFVWTEVLSPYEGYWAWVSDTQHETGSYAPTNEEYWWN